MVRPGDLVVSLSDIDLDDLHFVGEKAAGIKEGFAITARAYFKFLSEDNLETKIKNLIGSINFGRDDSLTQVAQHVKNLITKSRIPDAVLYRVIGHYVDIGASKVAAHMSIISGDVKHRNSAHEIVKNAHGEAVLLDTVRTLWAHLFEPRFIVYRNSNNLDHLRTGVAIIIEKI